MNKFFLVLMIVVAAVVNACGPDNNGLTSGAGAWTYTTADKKVKVDFELAKNSAGETVIQNESLTVEGVKYISAGQMTAVDLPDIGSIRINTNDPKAGGTVYYILFTNCTISGDFKRIDVLTGEYTLSGGTVSLKAISIVRP